MKESNDPGRTRTYNPQLRGPMPYPLATGPLGMGLHPSLELLVQPASGLRPTKPRRDDLDTINEVRRR